MIPEINPVQFGLRPPTKAVAAMAAMNAAANRPSMEDVHAFAADMRKRHPPGGYAPAPASLPGLGGHLDLYDSVGKPPAGPPHDFPFLKPLAGENPGNRLDTLI